MGGRGYPNIKSLKELSKYFSVSLDELLSNEEHLTVAQEDSKQKLLHFRDMVFGLLDCSLIMFLFLPFFGQKYGEIVQHVSMLSLTGIEGYVKIPYLFIVIGLFLFGILVLVLQNYKGPRELSVAKRIISGVCSLLSGIHWFTDIAGGTILSSGLVMLYYTIASEKKSKVGSSK